MPTKPYQSKLIPHLDLVKEIRKAGWSYRRIAAELEEKHQLKVDRTTIFAFVKVRSRKRRVIQILESPDSASPKRKSFADSLTDYARVRRCMTSDPRTFSCQPVRARGPE